MMPGAPARGINIPASSGQLTTGPGTYQGLMAVSGAAFNMVLWDGTGAAGTIVAAAQSTAGGTVVDNPGVAVFFAIGLYCQLVAGTPTGTVRV